MSVKTWGPPDGAPVLLLHCTLAQAKAWAGVVRHLPDTLHLIAPDLLAHGTAPDADRGADFHSQATETAVGHLPDRPAHIVGHSFGATLAMRIALEMPERVKTLTLIEPVLFCAAQGPGRAAHDAQYEPGSVALAKGDLSEAARVFLSLWGAVPFDDLPERQRMYMQHRIWIPKATEPALIDDNARIRARLDKISHPTLLIEGANSPPVVAEIATCLAAEIPNARRNVIPDAAHMCPLTHPGEVGALIAAHLAS